MGSEPARDRAGEVERATAAQFAEEAAPAEAPAWEEISSGRYLPRRIKGSFKGRALG
jgi:hypothetical protein